MLRRFLRTHNHIQSVETSRNVGGAYETTIIIGRLEAYDYASHSHYYVY